MRICWYWPYLRVEELALAEGFAADDRLVVLTTPRDDEPIVSPVAGCRIVADLPVVAARSEGTAAWMASRAATYVRRAWDRQREMRGGGFDVCHVMYLNPFTDGVALAALRRKVPVVSSVHDVVPHHTRVPARVERMLLAAEYRSAGTMVVHHAAIKQRLVEEFPVDPARVVVVPEQVWEPRPGPTPTRDGPPVVLLFGTFRRNKGIDVLLDAIVALRSEIEMRFVLAGRGVAEIESRVRSAAERDPRVVAELGYAPVERKHELYASADLVVLPYTSFASQSGVLRDAYSYRVPLVVSDVGALGETVREDGTGWVVPPGDAAALATTLLDAVRDPAARAAATAAADVAARARTPAETARRLRAVYEQAASSRC